MQYEVLKIMSYFSTAMSDVFTKTFPFALKPIPKFILMKR